MPTVPSATKCGTLGCNNARSRYNSNCMEHGGRDISAQIKYNPNDIERRQTNEQYNTRQWRTQRIAQLSKYPLCAKCMSEGIVAPAQCVDHLFPWTQIGKHAFYANVYQSLCNGCHTIKTHLEQRGILRKYGSQVVDFTIGDYHRVMRQVLKK